MKTCQLTLASIMIALLLLGCSRTDREPEAVPKNQVTIEKPADQTSDIAESAGKAKEAAIEIPDQAVNKAEELAEKTEATAKEISDEVIEKTTTGASPSVPEIITLENKKGKIILPHKKHSATIACKECHGDTDPGPMELGQEKGHALCQGCHKEKGAGPTTCNGCHEKKAIKAVEGC
jgi:vacuolar-type H+-ATPase subunit H